MLTNREIYLYYIEKTKATKVRSLLKFSPQTLRFIYDCLGTIKGGIYSIGHFTHACIEN